MNPEGLSPGMENEREMFLARPIETIGFSNGALKNLKQNQILTVGDLVSTPGEILNAIPYVTLYQLCTVANSELEKFGYKITFQKNQEQSTS